MATDYKEWITERAEELAQERYKKSYYDLPDKVQDEIFAMAEADYINRESARIDTAYDAAEEARLTQSISDDKG